MERKLACGVIEDAHAYAQRRADETGRRYMVSSRGKALAHCPENLAMLRLIEEEPVIYSPRKVPRVRRLHQTG